MEMLDQKEIAHPPALDLDHLESVVEGREFMFDRLERSKTVDKPTNIGQFKAD